MNEKLDRSFRDPSEETLKEIFGEMKDIKTKDDMTRFLATHMNGWVTYVSPRYSQDYDFLNQKWVDVLRSMPHKPKMGDILIVTYFDPSPEDHLLMGIVSERLAREGYQVRSMDFIQPCEKCGEALLTFEYYTKAKSNPNLKNRLPSYWSKRCRACLE